MSRVRKKLEEIDKRLSEIPGKERDLTLRYAQAKRRVEDLHRQLTDSIEQGAIGADLSTTDADVQKLTPRSPWRRSPWSRALAARAQRARPRAPEARIGAQQDREQHFDELAAELASAAQSTRVMLDEAIGAVEKATAAWNSMTSRMPRSF